MSITTTCPGCGAALSLSETTQFVTCQYCGTHFEVNLDQTTPALNKTEPPAQPNPDLIVPAAEDVISPRDAYSPPPSSADPFNPPISGQAAPADIYNPPIPGQAAANPAELYNPPIPGVSGGSPAYTPPPFNPSAQPTNRLSGRGLWLTIAITAGVVFCLSCLCLGAIITNITR